MHEGSAQLAYTRDDWNLAFDYTANFFTNEFDSVLADNPLVGTAAVGASDVGRVALAPENSSHRLSLTGAAAVPAPFPVRVAGTLSWGLRLQDANFIPMTANSALTGDPRLDLPSDGLDGRVRTMLGNIVVTARPTADLRIKARYRIYDNDNQTDAIQFNAAVIDGGDIQDRDIRTLTNCYRKQNASLEGRYKLAPKTTASLGFDWEHWNRSSEREDANSTSSRRR